MNWQPIETAPFWQEVIVHQKNAPPTKSNRNGVFTAVHTERGWTLSRHGETKAGYLFPPPTHWMSLPPPPAALAKDDPPTRAQGESS